MTCRFCLAPKLLQIKALGTPEQSISDNPLWHKRPTFSAVVVVVVNVVVVVVVVVSAVVVGIVPSNN